MSSGRAVALITMLPCPVCCGRRAWDGSSDMLLYSACTNLEVRQGSKDVVQAGRQAHVLRADVSALQVWACPAR